MINLAAAEQGTIAKLRFKKVFNSSFLFSTERISADFRVAVSFCRAFLQIILTRLLRFNSESTNNPSNFTEFWEDKFESPCIY